MAIQAQNSKLKVTPGGIIPVVNVSQYDVDRVLTFSLYDGNSAASIASGTTVAVEGTKPDGHGFQYEATLSGNTVTVNTTWQMTCVVGTVECKLVLRKGTQVIGTALFLMEVEKGGISDTTDISDTDIPMIVALATEQMLTAEAWAKGTKNGVDVGSTEPQYHNNSKYWSEESASSAEESEASAINAESSATAAAASAAQAKSWATYSYDPLTSGTNTNNAHYWCDQTFAKYNDMLEEIGTALNEIAAIEALLQLLFGSIYVNTQSGDRLITQNGDNLIISY